MRLGSGHAKHFFDRRETFSDLLETPFAKRRHARGDCLLANLIAGRVRHDQCPHLVVHRQHLVECQAPLISRVRAFVASLATIDAEPRKLLLAETNVVVVPAGSLPESKLWDVDKERRMILLDAGFLDSMNRRHDAMQMSERLNQDRDSLVRRQSADE